MRGIRVLNIYSTTDLKVDIRNIDIDKDSINYGIHTQDTTCKCDPYIHVDKRKKIMVILHEDPEFKRCDKQCEIVCRMAQKLLIKKLKEVDSK